MHKGTHMTASPASSHHTNQRALWLIMGLSASLVAMIGCAALAMAPAFAAQPSPTANVLPPLSWAAVDISKPTYTPSPEPTFTPTVPPTVQPTAQMAIELPTEIAAQPSAQSWLDMTVSSPILSQGPQATTASSPGGKYILVSISDQHLWAYDNGQLVYSFVASTGMRNSTRAGTFSVLDKIPNAYGATWNIWMPDWLGIYYSGTLENGIHALPILPDGNRLWSGYLGTPISFGCVVLGIDDAYNLYTWSDIGTPVEIRW